MLEQAYDLIRDLWTREMGGEPGGVRVAGWVRTVRISKNVGFIHLNDGSCFQTIQVVVDGDSPCFEQVAGLTIGSSIEVSGALVPSGGGEQDREIKAVDLHVLGLADSDFPIQKKRHTFEYLRTQAHLRPRTNTLAPVFRIRSLISQALHAFFAQEGFVYVHTPIITSNDCEGAGEMFRVSVLDPQNPPRNEEGGVDFAQDFFGRQTHLTVSGQLAVENYCLAHRKVYTFGPTFRAENSNTPRHAAEFWMVEPEIAFADLEDDMALAERMLRFVFRAVLEGAPQELAFLEKFVEAGLQDKLRRLVEGPYARMTYTQAVEHLERSGATFDFPVSWGMDLQTEHERYLTEKVCQGPVFVTDYPREIKAFYMRQNDDGRTVAAMDLLLPGVGELIGGSQREERGDLLRQRIREMGLSEEDYAWYLDLRRFGTAPHAGFGLGLERAVMVATGMSNIRDVIPYPRTPKNADF